MLMKIKEVLYEGALKKREIYYISKLTIFVFIDICRKTGFNFKIKIFYLPKHQVTVTKDKMGNNCCSERPGDEKTLTRGTLKEKEAVDVISTQYKKHKKKLQAKKGKVDYEHGPNNENFVQVDEFPDYLNDKSKEIHDKLKAFDYFKHKIPVYREY